MYRFAAAHRQESIVFGAAQPGYSHLQVHNWVQFMQQHEIQRVCCLLPVGQLAPYSSHLLDTYRQVFGGDRLCWAPLEDFQLVDSNSLTQIILPFLSAADQQNQKVVVHCAGGIGRTGQVLAAWLVYGRGLSNRAAIAAVRQSGRNPYEAAIAAVLKGQNPWRLIREVNHRLDHCRLFPH